MASRSLLNALDQSYVPGVQPAQPVPSTSALSGHPTRSQDDDDMPYAAPSREDTGGFRLNYDDNAPLRPIDFGGLDQEQRLAEFVTKSIENTSNSLTVKEAMKKLGLKDKRDLIPGLEVRLLSHQCIGVAWMLDKERSQDKGGILADDMGLGKTVQMIATMALNMPKLEDDCKTTLVIVPAALLQQWKDEVETKTNGLFTVHIHHSRDKLKKLADVKSKDVVITSYQTFCQDFAIPPDILPEEELDWLSQHGGLLSRVRFYRVVADEAHFIRNRATRSSRSLSYTKAVYRWMLTGTPVTNTLTDIYGLLRFGRFRPWNDWNSFAKYIAKVQVVDAPLAGARAQSILQPLLLRRTKNSTLDGEPLLQLPAKEIEIAYLTFTKEEREIYDYIERKTQLKVNKFIKEGTLFKYYEFILVWILRLRQLCCHPYLALSLKDGSGEPTMLVASASEKELNRAKKVMGMAWVNQIKQRLLRQAVHSRRSYSNELGEDEATCSNCKDLFMNDSRRVLACGHEICFDCTLELMNSAIIHDGVFGTGDEKENLAVEKEYETALAKGWRPCPTCRKMVDLKSPDKVFKASAFEPTDEEIQAYNRHEKAACPPLVPKSGKPTSPAKSIPDELLSESDDDLPDVAQMMEVNKKKDPSKANRKMMTDDKVIDIIDLAQTSTSPGKSKKRKANESDTDSEIEILETSFSEGKRPRGGDVVLSTSENKAPSEATFATWGRGDDDMEASIKMLRMLEYLKEWDTCGDKTIIYSQWTSMLDLVERLFSRHGIRSLRFDGKMDRIARNIALADFKKPGGPRVMLISTKCGSVGLNLVMANRIINMDLSWNYAAESQAYDRCHRIGQEKSVYVKRLVVEDTIEERMLKLQDVKMGLAEAALGEGQGARLHKLSVKDIKYLFGMDPKEKNARRNNAQS